MPTVGLSPLDQDRHNERRVVPCPRSVCRHSVDYPTIPRRCDHRRHRTALGASSPPQSPGGKRGRGGRAARLPTDRTRGHPATPTSPPSPRSWPPEQNGAEPGRSGHSQINRALPGARVVEGLEAVHHGLAGGVGAGADGVHPLAGAVGGHALRGFGPGGIAGGVQRDRDGGVGVGIPDDHPVGRAVAQLQIRGREGDGRLPSERLVGIVEARALKGR